MTKDSPLRFFKEPTLENFSDFLEENIGETNSYEFKSEWIDIEKIAQILMGMGNSGGGCIVIGVAEENGRMESQGIQKDIYDASDFTKKICKYIPDSIVGGIELVNFFYDHDAYGSLKNKKFQMIMIHVEDDKIPIVCKGDSKQFNKGDIFIRRGTNTEKVNYDELQMLLNKKVQADKAKITDEGLKEQLQQLKILYDAIPTVINNYSFSGLKQSSSPIFLQMLGKEKNMVYPEKSYEEFLVDEIQKKQEKIQSYL